VSGYHKSIEECEDLRAKEKETELKEEAGKWWGQAE